MQYSSRKFAYGAPFELKTHSQRSLPLLPAPTIPSPLRLARKHQTVLLYLLIGTSAALVDVFLFVFFYGYLGVSGALSTVYSIALSTLYGFTMNVSFNFRTFDRLWRRFFSYASVSMIAVIASALSLFIFTDLFGIDGTLVKLLSLPPIVLAQYLLNRKYSFSALEENNNSTTS